MKIFRKPLTPEGLGATIYESLRASLASEGDLSISSLLRNIAKIEAELPEQFVGAIMVGSMFGAVLAIERSTPPWIGDRITAGMQDEFFRHLQEQGATPKHIADWKPIVAEHFQIYRESLQGYEGFEPPWKLGRQFLWNIVGYEEYLAASIKSATLHLLEARDAAQKLLNDRGPSLDLDRAI